jgi:hypothetical protein
MHFGLSPVAPRMPFGGEHRSTPPTVRGISSGAQLPHPYLVFKTTRMVVVRAMSADNDLSCHPRA